MAPKHDSDDISFLLRPWWVSVIIGVFGLFLLSLTFPIPRLGWVGVDGMLKAVLTAVGASIVAVGFVDFLVNISTVKEYVALTVSNMYRKETLLKLGLTQLKEIRADATSAILEKRVIHERDAVFLGELDEGVLNGIIDDYYIESYEVTIHFKVNDDCATVTKKVWYRWVYAKAVPRSVSISPIRAKYIQAIPGIEVCKIVSCQVDGQDYTSEIKLSHSQYQGINYDTKYSSDWCYEIRNDHDMTRVDLVMEIVVPITDFKTIMLQNRVCKRMTVDFIHDSNDGYQANLSANVFCSKPSDASTRTLPADNHLRVTVDKPMVPGDGVALFWQLEKQ